MEQFYGKYTTDDHLVWELLYDQQIRQIQEFASSAYLRGLEQCKFERNRIPRITELNNILLNATGWSIHVVPGLIDNYSFFKLLSIKKFPASTWLRKLESLDYLQEPDMFHDILGHVPLLTDPGFCNFLVDLAKVALIYIEDENAIEFISRLYWYTVEFGLIYENDKLKIYGGGILSSKSETVHALYAGEPLRIPFNLQNIIETPYIKDKFQQQYYSVNNYKEVYGCINDLRYLLYHKTKQLIA